MAYNNGFPIGYQPIQSVQPMQPVQQAQPNVNMQQQQMYQQPAIQTQQPQSSDHGIIWVQGDAGAKSYLVAPNQSVMLMDSEQNCFYIKSADASSILAGQAQRAAEVEQYVNPTAVPAYIVQNPNCCTPQYGTGCGC